MNDFFPDICLYPSHEVLAKAAAKEIVATLNFKRGESCAIAFATGKTFIPFYAAVVELCKGGLDLSNIHFFNLDEYERLSPNHPGSFHAYMRRHLYNHIHVPQENIHILDGMTTDAEAMYAAFERTIQEVGGIDLQFSGVGVNRHVGFCEKGARLDGRTGRVKLLEQTRRSNANDEGFDGDWKNVPETAFSMGLGTMLEARRHVVLACNPSKRGAVDDFLFAPITTDGVTADAPITALRQSNAVTLYVDHGAYPQDDLGAYMHEHIRSAPGPRL